MKGLLTTALLLGSVAGYAQFSNNTNIYVAPDEELHIKENTTNNVGASIEVDEGALLHIYDNTLVNNGTVTFENNSSLLRGTSGNGVTNDGTGGGTYIYKRQGATATDEYNFWSSPMQTQNSSVVGPGYMFDPSQGTNDISDDSFDPGWVAPSANMTVGRGYASTGAGLVAFNGKVNNGTLTPYSVSSYANPNPTAGGTPFNVIGNPFPSGLSVASFINRNFTQLGRISGAVYLWDDPGTTPYDSQDFATINAAGTVSNGNGSFNSGSWNGSIAAGQGFEVEAISDGPIEFNNTMRTHDNNQFYALDNLTRVWFNIENADYYNETLVAFIDDATDNRDHMYDAKKIIGQMSLSLFTMLDGDGYAIQAYPELNNLEKIVDVGTTHGTDGEYRFRLKEVQNWYPGVSIYLEDVNTGFWTNLLEDSVYSYEATAGIDFDRFKLHFLPPTVTTIENEQQLNVLVFQSHQDLIIDFSGQEIRMASVELFDMLGKHVITPREYASVGNRIRIPISTLAYGNYIVRVSSPELTLSQKFIKHY